MKGLRVLVVDDEPQIQRFLSVALTAAGYEVLTAETGAQALRQAATGAPDHRSRSWPARPRRQGSPMRDA